MFVSAVFFFIFISLFLVDSGTVEHCADKISARDTGSILAPGRDDRPPHRHFRYAEQIDGIWSHLRSRTHRVFSLKF